MARMASMPRGSGSSTAALDRGVRLVAVFEALKGALVLGVGLGLLSLVHHDLQAVAERLVRHSHPRYHDQVC